MDKARAKRLATRAAKLPDVRKVLGAFENVPESKPQTDKMEVLEKKIAEVHARLAAQANAPMPDAQAGQEVGKVALAETQMRAPSVGQQRHRLIAAHVALEAVAGDLRDYRAYEAVGTVQREIAARLGELELKGF